MKKHIILCAAAAIAVGASVSWADPTPIFQPGDPIRAFDPDPNVSSSSYPGGENPPAAIDGSTGSKYLNFGRSGSGFIVIPSAASIIQSFQLTTANDSSGRDPASYRLFGTNDPITSPDNSSGLSENWSLISSGALTLPPPNSFFTPYAPVDFGANATSYSAYKLFFPTTRNNNDLMQFSEVQFYTATGGPGGGGSTVLAPGNNIRAIDDPLGTQSAYPTGEEPSKAIDRLYQAPVPPNPPTDTKHLNFGKERSGLIVTPSIGASIADAIQFTTANDAQERDPVLIAIYGTNDPITSPDNGTGTNENWTLIVNSLPYVAPTDRYTPGPVVTFANSTPWTSYKIVILDVRNAPSANSTQYGEVQLFSGAVPEPTTLSLAFAGIVGLALRRRRA